MTHLHLDFETRSHLDIKEVGLDRYARSAEVLMLAWAIDDGPVKLWLPKQSTAYAVGHDLPTQLSYYLLRASVQKVAWHAAFERAIFLHCLGLDIPAEQWLDPSQMARYASLPGKLAQVSEILRLDGFGKNKDGVKLIRKFCVPKKTGSFVQPHEAPEDWQRFCEYCRQDVVAERVAMHRLKAYALPEREQQIRLLDAKINETGLPVDTAFVERNLQAVASEKKRLFAEMTATTGLANPNSRQQLLGWLRERGYASSSLGAKKVEFALADPALPSETRRVLELRQQTSKSSTAKLDALKAMVVNGRLRQCYTYYGAARTGRWAGAGPQPHNFPRKPVKIGEHQVDLRNVFHAPAGKKLVVCDLGAIENRVLGWVSGCSSILNVFANGLDPYLDFATRLYVVTYDAISDAYKSHDKDAVNMRQMSKPAVLGCGYGLGGGDYVFDCCFEKVDKGHREKCKGDGDAIKTGLWGYAAGLGVDMTREQAHECVAVFRAEYPEVKHFWYGIEDDVRNAILNPGEIIARGSIRIGCTYDGSRLVLGLPSGRRLHYMKPRLAKGAWPDGQERIEITFEGLDGITKQWCRQKTYGGRLTENIVQALSRDILADGLLRADAAGFEIVGHTHDEIITLVDGPVSPNLADLARLRDCMIVRPSWAPDLPLAADGYEGEVYHK